MLSRRQSFFNILDPDENCGRFRKLSRALKGYFARIPNPFSTFADHVATTPAAGTDKGRERRNCEVPESNDVQHLRLHGLRNVV
jgi:hypothetical protein